MMSRAGHYKVRFAMRNVERVLGIIFGILLLLPGLCGTVFLPIMLTSIFTARSDELGALIIPIVSILIGWAGVVLLRNTFKNPN